MTKEEKQAIDTLQNCIADYVIGDFCCGKYCPDEDMCKNDDCPYEKAIDIVVNLVEKQQEEIEQLEDNFDEVYMKAVADYKDKIREKIEFYKRYGKIKNSNEYVMSVEIEVLQELLEGE